MSRPGLLFDPEGRQALYRGFDKLAAAMEVTLGPRGRLVAVEQDIRRRPPELIDDGATVARRFIGLPDRFESMGALLARHIAWKVEEKVGDGTTSAVLLARQLFGDANRLAAAGHDVMAIRRGLERCLLVALSALDEQMRPLEDDDQIRALATAITGSEALGNHIEEIFDVVGADGAVDVRNSYARTHDRRYIRGVLWNNGWISSYFAPDGHTSKVDKPYILFTDRELRSGNELLPILEMVKRKGDGGLVVLAVAVENEALNLLVTNRNRGGLETLAVKAPGLGSEKLDVLEDLAALCGGRVIGAASGQSLARVSLEDLGRADEVQAIRSSFTVIGGKGRPAAVRQRVDDLRGQLKEATYGRPRNRLIERIGKLQGGVALLEIGGATDVERDFMKDRAKEAVRVVRLGLQSGMVPGGGIALSDCRRAVESLELSSAEAPARAIFCEALQSIIRALITNAGLEPAPILARLEQSEAGHGYDVVNEEIVDMFASHIIDPLLVVRTALGAGVSGALMALTTDVLVHLPRSNRDEAVDFQP